MAMTAYGKNDFFYSIHILYFFYYHFFCLITCKKNVYIREFHFDRYVYVISISELNNYRQEQFCLQSNETI